MRQLFLSRQSGGTDGARPDGVGLWRRGLAPSVAFDADPHHHPGFEDVSPLVQHDFNRDTLLDLAEEFRGSLFAHF